LLQSPYAVAAATGEGDAEDAQSCCFETPGGGAAATAADAVSGATSCKACRVTEAFVPLLPCRRLCLCGTCEAAVDACPVCATTKIASVHVLLSCSHSYVPHQPLHGVGNFDSATAMARPKPGIRQPTPVSSKLTTIILSQVTWKFMLGKPRFCASVISGPCEFCRWKQQCSVR
ncbi:Os02g0246101, partial [Oryza sativa Japonica Group]